MFGSTGWRIQTPPIKRLARRRVASNRTRTSGRRGGGYFSILQLGKACCNSAEVFLPTAADLLGGRSTLDWTRSPRIWSLSPKTFCALSITLNDPVRSRDDVVNDFPVHVGQPEVAALVAIRQAFVVEPHQVQDRGMQIVEMDLIPDRIISVLVGLAVTESRFHRP